MELNHTFTVPASLADTWQTFEDIDSVAGCFPGATVTEIDGDDFKGTCKVKLGPIALVYTGTGHVPREGRGRPQVRHRGEGQGQARQRHRRGDGHRDLRRGGAGVHARRRADRPGDHREARAVRPRGHPGRLRQAPAAVRHLPAGQGREARGARAGAGRGAGRGRCDGGVARVGWRRGCGGGAGHRLGAPARDRRAVDPDGGAPTAGTAQPPRPRPVRHRRATTRWTSARR